MELSNIIIKSFNSNWNYYVYKLFSFLTKQNRFYEFFFFFCERKLKVGLVDVGLKSDTKVNEVSIWTETAICHFDRTYSERHHTSYIIENVSRK